MMQEAWRKLLIPDAGYEISDLWQVLVALLVLLLCVRYVPASKSPGDRAYNCGIRSMVLLAIWDSFKANGIEIPFPQRDLHIRSSSVDFVNRKHPDLE